MIVATPRGDFGVTCTGEGPPIVLCHSLAMSGRMWADAVVLLRNRFTVWTVDARGHGESGWDGIPFTVDDMAEDLIAVYDAVGLDRPHLVGLSMGGCTAIVLAATHPDRVTGLVLADTTACYGPDRVRKWDERATQAEHSPREQLIPFQLDRWLTPAFMRQRPDVVGRLVRAFLDTAPRVHATACRALGAFDGQGLLSQITAPTLVLVGEDDYATPPTMARMIAQGVPGAMLRELPGLRHMSLVEDESLWTLVGEHLAQSSARVEAPVPDG